MKKASVNPSKLISDADADPQLRDPRVPTQGIMPPMGNQGPASPLKAAVLGPLGPQGPRTGAQMPRLPRPRGIKGTTDFKSLMGALKQRQ